MNLNERIEDIRNAVPECTCGQCAFRVVVAYAPGVRLPELTPIHEALGTTVVRVSELLLPGHVAVWAEVDHHGQGWVMATIAPCYRWEGEIIPAELVAAIEDALRGVDL